MVVRASKKAKRERYQARKERRDPKNNPQQVVREPLKALNPRQQEYIRSITKGDQVFTLGPAGTGKTYIAATIAADMLLDEKIEKVVLSRPAVGVDEEHGFLPGDINKKIAPWVVPFTEVMQKRMGKERYRQAMLNGQIEIVPIAYMRGRTFDKALVFLDEAQNTTYSQIKMFLTRVGEGAKVIVNGDIRQTDLSGESGLATVLEMIRHQGLQVPVVEFTNEDVVRSGICKMWATAFDKVEGSYSDTKQAHKADTPITH